MKLSIPQKTVAQDETRLNTIKQETRVFEIA